MERVWRRGTSPSSVDRADLVFVGGPGPAAPVGFPEGGEFQQRVGHAGVGSEKALGSLHRRHPQLSRRAQALAEAVFHPASALSPPSLQPLTVLLSFISWSSSHRAWGEKSLGGHADRSHWGRWVTGRRRDLGSDGAISSVISVLRLFTRHATWT